MRKPKRQAVQERRSKRQIRPNTKTAQSSVAVKIMGGGATLAACIAFLVGHKTPIEPIPGKTVNGFDGTLTQDVLTNLATDSMDVLLGPGGTELLQESWGRAAFLVQDQSGNASSSWSDRYRSIFDMSAYYQMMYTPWYEQENPGRDGFDDDRLKPSAKNVLTYHKGFKMNNMNHRNNLFAGYLTGSTAVQNHADQVSPSLRHLCCWIARVTDIIANTNLYLTGPATQGFALHQDNQDVFILQLGGSKRWTVYENPSLPKPFEKILVRDKTPGARPDELSKYSWEDEYARAGLSKHSTAEDLMGQASTFNLNPGDVLYVPRGFPHYAETTDDLGSLHITMSLGTEQFSAVQLISDAIIVECNKRGADCPSHTLRDKMSAAAIADLDSVALRESLPLMFASCTPRLREVYSNATAALNDLSNLTPQERDLAKALHKHGLDDNACQELLMPAIQKHSKRYFSPPYGIAKYQKCWDIKWPLDTDAVTPVGNHSGLLSLNTCLIAEKSLPPVRIQDLGEKIRVILKQTGTPKGKEALDYPKQALGAPWEFVARRLEAGGAAFRVADIPAADEFSQLSIGALLLRLNQAKPVESTNCEHGS